MIANKKPKDYPFYVRQTGTIPGVCGFDDLASAQADADKRNAKAEDMGIKTRYESVSQ